MTNQEIIDQLDEIINLNDNYCDFLLEVKKFNKEYKKSNFYKKTHISLKQLIKDYKFYQFMNLELLFKLLQQKINSLDFTNLQNIYNEFEKTVSTEIQDNQNVLSVLSDFSELFKDIDRGN